MALLFLALSQLLTIIFIPVMTLTRDNIPGKFASFSTCPASATLMGTLQTIAGSDLAPHPQLNQAAFQPVTPLKPDRLEQLLHGHPNKALVQYVLQGLRHGFSLKYIGHRVGCEPQNLPSDYEFPELLKASLDKEVKLGHMLGLFVQSPIPDLTCSLVGMVPKKGTPEMGHITHLSHPQGSSIISFRAPEDATTDDQTFNQAVQLLAKARKNAFVAKADAKSAFWNIPMCIHKMSIQILHRLLPSIWGSNIMCHI